MVRHRRLALLGCVAILSGACRDGADVAAGTDGMEATGGEVRPTPFFVEPASGVLNLPVTRATDVVLGVASIEPGLTALLIDGRNVGPLLEPGPIGRLDLDTLTVRIRGGLVPGRHTWQLSTPSFPEAAGSQVIDVVVGDIAAPTIVAELTEVPDLRGTAIHAEGIGVTGVLTVVDDTEPGGPVVHLLPAAAEGWDPQRRITLAVPGYASHASESGPAVAAALIDPDDPDGGRVRVAWRVGRPGRAIAARQIRLDGSPGGEPVTLTELDPATVDRLVGPVEWAELGRPAIAGEGIVAALVGARDSEVERPGDRGLIYIRWDGHEPTPARRIQLGPARNIDRLGPAIDLRQRALHQTTTLAVRLDGVHAAVVAIEVDSGTESVLPLPDAPRPAFVSPRSSMTAVVGAMEAITAVAIGDQRINAAQLDAALDTAVDASIPPTALPDPATASGDPAVGVIAGAPVFLVPFGDSAPVQAIISTAANPAVEPLEGVFCDAVALAATDAGLADESVGFGCLQAAQTGLGGPPGANATARPVSLGRLRVVPP